MYGSVQSRSLWGISDRRKEDSLNRWMLSHRLFVYAERSTQLGIFGGLYQTQEQVNVLSVEADKCTFEELCSLEHRWREEAGQRRSIRGVVAAATFSTHTHLKLQPDNKLLSLSLSLQILFCCIFWITDSLQDPSLQRHGHNRALFLRIPTPAAPSLSGGTALSPCLLLFLPPGFVLSFAFSPSGGASPATVTSVLCRAGRREAGEKNTGTNQGCESGAEGHRLGFICVKSLSLTRSHNRPSIPSPTWGRITPPPPRNMISSSLPSSPTMITDFTAEKRRNTQSSWTSFSPPVHAGALLWDAQQGCPCVNRQP